MKNYKEVLFMTILERIKYAAGLVEVICCGLFAEIAIQIWKKRNLNRLNDISKDYAYLAIRLKAMEYFYRTPIGKRIAPYSDEDYQFMLSCYERGLEGKEYTE